MLDVMRKHSRSTLIYVLFGMLIAVFVLTFGPAWRQDARPGGEVEVMAEVGGVVIDGATLNLAVMLSTDPPAPGANKFEAAQAQQIYDHFRLRFARGQPEAAAMVPHAGAPSPIKVEKVMAELIEAAVIAEQAKKLGLSVSDTELAKRVVALAETFGQEIADTNKAFDSKKYEQFVRYRLGMSKATLEEFLRREILREKMVQIVTQGILPAPAEVEALHQADVGRARLELLTVDAVTVSKAITVTAADAEAWAVSHADAITSEYALQINKYKVPDKFNLRAILIAAPNPEDETDEAKKKDATSQRAAKRDAAQSIRADLDKAWAGEIKLDPIAPKSNDPDKPVPAAVGEPKTATEVTGDERAGRLLQYFSKVAADKTDDSIYKDEGGKYVEDYDAEKLGRQPFGPAVAAAVTGAKVVDLIGPVEGKKGWWVIAIENKIAGKETPLAEARIEIATSLLQRERGEKELDAIAQAAMLAAQATPTTPLAEVVKAFCKARGVPEDALATVETPPLGKSPLESLQDISFLFGMAPKSDDPDTLPMIGKHAEMARAVAKLTAAAPVADRVFQSDDKKVRHVVRLAARKPGDDKAEAKARETLARTLQGMRRQEAWRAYAIRAIEDATRSGQIKKSEAFQLKVKEEKARADDLAKKAAASQPAEGAPGSSPLQLNVGGKPIEVKLGGPDPASGGGAPAKGGGAPDAPAK